MDLEQISPNLQSFFILLGKIRQDLPHFCIIKIVNTIASLVFFVLGVFLIVAFILNREVEAELQKAANFDLWSLFILSSGTDYSSLLFIFCLSPSDFDSGIFSLVTATIFGIGALKVLSMNKTFTFCVSFSELVLPL